MGGHFASKKNVGGRGKKKTEGISKDKKGDLRAKKMVSENRRAFPMT